MKKIFYTTAAAMLLSVAAFAQSAEDALRFSQNIYSGTARFSAMGGAFGALGGDFSGLSINPAGLGVYRASELSLTGFYNNSKTKSQFGLGPTRKDSRSNGDFNFGYVQSLSHNDDGMTFNIGLGYNTLADFNRNITSTNSSANKSIVDVLADKAYSAGLGYYKPNDMKSNDRYYNYGVSDWDVVMGWNTKILDTAGGNFYNILSTDDKIEQRRLVETKGQIGEAALSFGGNYKNKLFFGVTIGVQDIEYKSNVSYDETVQTTLSDPTDLEWLHYNQYYETQGTGYNVKLGLMYREGNLRLGAAIHTPTWLRLTDYYQASMNSHFTSDSRYFDDEVTPENEYDYKITTPAKYVGSIAYTFGSYGLLSFDYEYVDYSTMKLKERYREDRGAFDADNEYIKQDYKGVSNFRVGAEFKLSDNFALRGGYAYYGSPYEKYKDAKTLIWSAGAGYRTNGFYLDAAYRNIQTKSAYEIFDESDIVYDKYTRHQVVLTLGFKF